MTPPNGPTPRKPKPSVKPQSRTALPNVVSARTAQTSQTVANPTAPALSKWLVFSVVGGILMGIISVTTILSFLLQRSALPVPPVALDNTGPNSTVAVVEKPAALVKLDTAKATPKVAPVINTNTVAIVATKPVEVMPSEIKPQAKPLSPVFANIAAKGRILSLPKRDQGITAVGSTSSAPEELCKVFAKNLSDCELKLSTTETFAGEPRLFLESDPTPEPGTRSWTVMSRTKKDVFGESNSKAIGRFILHDGTQDHALTFAWDPEVPEWSNPFGLSYCKLDVQVGSEKVACSLSKPTMIPAEKLDLTIHRRSLAIGIPARSLASSEFLRLDLELHLGDWSDGAYLINVNTSPLTKLVVPKDSENGDGRVELEFRFTPPGEVKGAELAYAAFVFPTVLTEVPGKVPEWKREPKRVDQIDKALKDGFTSPDFQNVQKAAAIQKLAVQSKISELKRSIQPSLKKIADKLEDIRRNRTNAAEAKNASRVAAYDREISDLEEELRSLNGRTQPWQDALKFSEESAAWIAEMRQRFVEIERKLEVRFSVYLDYGNERVVLAETNPPPNPPSKWPESKLPTK